MTKHGSMSMRLSLITLVACCSAFISEALHAQLVTNNGASVKTCTGSIVQVNGSVDNASGTYDNTGTTTITGNCTNSGTIGDSGRINLAGDWINNNYFNDYIGKVEMYGTSPQNFSGAQLTTFYDLIISGGSAKTCHIAQMVEDTMDFKSGIVYTSQSNLLTFTTSGDWKEGSSSSYIDGPCGKDFKSTNEFTYPVGKHSRFNKCGVKPDTSTSNTFRCEYFDTAYTNTTSVDSSLKCVSKSQYWNVDRTSGSCNAKVRLYWIHGDYNSSAIAKISDLKVGRWTGTLWTSEGVTSVTGSYDTGNIVSRVCTTWGLLPNEHFTIACDSTTTSLPVELDHFAAKQEGSHVRLDWLTRSESQNLGFEIERSTGGNVPSLIQSWQTDASLMAKSHYGASYVTLDDPLADGLYTYDLYQRDVDGARWKVASRTLLFKQTPDAASTTIEIFPNPVVDHAQLRIGLQQDIANMQIDIFDAAGRKMLTQSTGQLSVGYQAIALVGLNRLPSGRYTIVASSPDNRFTRSMVISK